MIMSHMISYLSFITPYNFIKRQNHIPIMKRWLYEKGKQI